MKHYANDLHAMLNASTLPEATAKVEDLIEKHGYYAVRNDPGVRAWVADNIEPLRTMAAQRRQARQQQNAFGLGAFRQ